jgi:anion-transporting  ArsA/GET3 family ATPase
MNCEALLRRRLLFLSGKGGVGKSILAAGLALCAARDGKRVLLVELDTIETLPGIFALTGARDPYREYRLADRIRGLHVDGRSGLEEYLEMVLKSRRLTRRIFRSPIYQYFINIAPGLKELMAVGKLWDLEQKTDPRTGQPLYDLIIVDTPATGHTMSYLQMPITAADTVRKGFVNKEAQKVVDLLRDPAKTSFNIVTTLAEMPVNEALELREKIADHLKMPLGFFFINRVYPPFFQGDERNAYLAWKTRVKTPGGPPEEPAILACAESWKERRKAQDFQREKLVRNCLDPMVVLPLLPGCESDLDLADRLSRAISSTG